MRVLFLIPGGAEAQLQALPIAAAVAEGLTAQLQVACPAAMAPLWKMLPAVEKVLPFGFDSSGSLAEWANLLGSVKEPDFQACINLASGWSIDLLLGLSHIPIRVKKNGLEAFLSPLGLNPKSTDFRLKLPESVLAHAQSQLPQGNGPLLLLAPAGGPNDWPASNWQNLPEFVKKQLPQTRITSLDLGNIINQAAQIASVDVVVSSNPVASLLADLTGVTLVDLEQLKGNQPLNQLNQNSVLTALGMA
jgi:ADP-heptose:LPS heptosyltransferase